MIDNLKGHIILAVFGLFFHVGIQAQDQDGEILDADAVPTLLENQEVIDSLVILLTHVEDDTNKVDLYIQLSDLHLDQDHAEALRYSQEALTMSSHIGSMDCMLKSHLSIAHIYLAYIVDFDKAINEYDAALEIAIELEDRESEMIAYKGKSYIYGSLENYDAAEDYLEQAISIAEELEDTERISVYNGYLGDIYEEDGDTIKALACYKKVVEIERERNFHGTSDASLMVAAHYYFLLGDMDEAIHFYRISLKRFQREQNYRWQSYTHSQLAMLHMHQGNFDKAENHAINGLSLAQDFNLSKEITDNYLVLIDVTDSLGKHDLSSRYQEAYDTLMNHLHKDKDAINSKLDFVQLVENTEGSPVAQAVEATMNRFIQAVVITLPVALLLLLMAMPARRI